MSDLLKCIRCDGEFKNTEGKRFKECLDCRLERTREQRTIDCVEYISRSEGKRINTGFRMLAHLDINL